MSRRLIAPAALTALVAGLGAYACLPTAGLRRPDLPRVEQGALHVIFFDIGQADATLVWYNGKSLLIDAGASRAEPERIARRVPRRLEALLGTNHVDYLLVTHYHSDHIGSTMQQKGKRQPSGLYALFEREGLSVGTLLDRGPWRIDDKGGEQREYERARASWLASGKVSAYREVRAGDRIELGGKLALEVVAASGNGQLERLRALSPAWFGNYSPTENDYSVAVKLRLGDFELFTGGDLSGVNVLREFGTRKESYNDIESSIAGAVGPVEVYHAHHHGSHNSSNPCFVQVLAPQVSIITSGNNGYGHPDPEVYARLLRAGAVRVVSGADARVRDISKSALVGDDVEVVVAPDGRRYWVNGDPFTSRSEAEEQARPGYRASCDDTLGRGHTIEQVRDAESEDGASAQPAPGSLP